VKKPIIGCAIIALLLAVVGIGATYWLYRKVSTTVSQFAELASVPEIERQVRNTAAFSAPASGELTESQVTRFVAVQTRVRERLGARFAEVQSKYKTLIERKQATALDLPQTVSAYRDLAASWMDARRAQVEALNAADFSLEEYSRVRNQVYAAIGLPIMSVDVGKLVENVTSGSTGEEPATMGGAVGPSGPEQNRKMVEPFSEQLHENAALASFGL